MNDARKVGMADALSGPDRWYVLRTKPLKEETVCAQLLALGIRTFFPRIARRPRSRSRERRLTPLFPGYLFLEGSVEGRTPRIRYLIGVQDFLRCDGSPQSLGADLVDGLRRRADADGVCELPPPRFRPGQPLVIREGPLRGLDVVFEYDLSGPERVAVLLSAVQLSARVIVSRECLGTT